MQKMYTYKDVAEILRVSERTVWSLVKENKLKACKAGRLVRITEEALKEYIDSIQAGV